MGKSNEGHRIKAITIFLILLAELMLLGCATFSGKRLPELSVKPQTMVNVCLVTECVAYDSITAMGGSAPGEYFAPALRQVMGEHAGRLPQVPALQEAIDAQMSAFNALPEHERRILIACKTTSSVSNDGREPIYRVEDLTGGMPLCEVEAIYRKRVADKETRAFIQNMVSDPKFREKMLASGLIWFDCRTSVVEGNSSTWLLEGVLCSLSLSLIPAHHRKDIDVTVSIYANGEIIKREYKDCVYNVVWLPLFPIGLAQGDWPDQNTYKSVLANMAANVVNDFQKEKRSGMSEKIGHD
jgi:hypothetical protein